MKYSDLSSKKRSLYYWINFAAASLLAAALAGCGGGGSSNSDVAPVVPPPPPPAGATAPVVPVPTGTAPVTMADLTPAQFAALTPAVPAVSVTIASPPKVTFSLTDGKGNAIIGFGSTSLSSTATVATYPNISFVLAKLKPETSAVVAGKTLRTPSRWVSYIMTTVPTKNATTGVITASVFQKPLSDNTGTLVDNGNGTYTYTFFRDITKVADDVKAAVAAGTLTQASADDMDDMTFEPNLVHRLAIQISGNAPGTGSNTADAKTVTPGVLLTNALNVIYDFIPATGQQVTDSGREIVATQKCNDCHQSLGGFPETTPANSDARFHGGNRNDVRFCVVCHTEQLKFGHVDASTKLTAAGNYDGKDTYKINGLSAGRMPSHIHKIHMSEDLTKTGYVVGSIKYEEACRFPQDIRNCTKCHDGSATSTAKTAQGDNWMNVPHRVACGACHDGIDFRSGNGVTLKDRDKDVAANVAIGTTASGHAGGAQLDDSACGFCHTPDLIPTYHIPVTPPAANNFLAGGTNKNTNAAFIASNTSRLPVGAKKVTYEIQSVARNASKQPVMVFRMLQDGLAVPFNTFNPAASLASQEMWTNFMGSPSVYFVFAVPQDGIAAPSDFNASVNVYLRSIWNGSATGTKAATLSAPDSSGFYTVTFTGVQIPDSAVMLTGGLGYSYNNTTSLPLTQTNLTTDYPTKPAVQSTDATMPNKTGGLLVVAPDQQKVAGSGAPAIGTVAAGGPYTGRRAIVEDARCNKCHLELGPFTKDAFHAGQRNDGTTCAWCHNPNQNNGGWSGDSAYFVHSIHAAAKRAKPFTWDVTAADDWSGIGYPGVLKTCETCHVPDGYDFSSADAKLALNNRLYRTAATGTTAAAGLTTSPYIAQTAGTAYGSAFSFTATNGAGTTAVAAGTTLVNSPITAVCVACHDGVGTTGIDAIIHMQSNGGKFYATRSSVYNTAVPGSTDLVNSEQCILCHGSNSTFGLGIKAVHAR